MVQELTSISKKTVAIIGGGPAGCICGKFLYEAGIDVTIFDKAKVLNTLLPTGGGRCNLAHANYDFKTLASNYPRGEKFLYSVFSRFGTNETLDFFRSIGVETYNQDNGRIFPVSNSSKDVREKFLKSLKCKVISENIRSVSTLKSGYELVSDKSKYFFDVVVIALGGHGGYEVLKNFDINIISPVPALVGLVTEKDFSEIAGVSLKNVECKINNKIYCDDIIFTHKGVSGPLIYTVSSLKARDKMPYKINLKIVNDFDFQKLLNNNPHKDIKNLLSALVPKSFAQFLLDDLGINSDIKCCYIDGKIRDIIYKSLVDFEIIVSGRVPDGEVVTCGGVDLNEINSKTMESKKYNNLYFCGEVLDIDGFCGGYNLQNCWSTGYLAADSIINNLY